MKIIIKLQDSNILDNRTEEFSLFETAKQALENLENEYKKQAQQDHDCKNSPDSACPICAEISQAD